MMSPAFRSRKDGSHYPLSHRRKGGLSSSSTSDGWIKRREGIAKSLYDDHDANKSKREGERPPRTDESWEERVWDGGGAEPELAILADSEGDAEKIRDDLADAGELGHYYKGREITKLPARSDGLSWFIFSHSSECGDGECQDLRRT